MSAQPIQIALSPEVLELIVDNEIDLVAEIQKQIPGGAITPYHGPPPSAGADEPEKSVALIILASGTAIYLVAQAIERVLNAIGNKSVVVTEQSPTSKDKPANSAALLTPRISESSETAVSFLGLSVKLKSERKQGA